MNKNIKRDKLIKAELDRFELKYHRISGIELTENDIATFSTKSYEYAINDIKFKFNGRMKSTGVVGCMLAHISALKYIKDHNLKGNTLIVEDDVSFKYINNFNKTFNDIISEAPKDFSILKVHSSNFHILEDLHNRYENGEKYINANKLPENYLMSTCCYIISEKGVNEFYNKYYNSNEETFIIKNKHIVADIILYKIKDVYVYTYPLCCNNITRSDICGRRNFCEMKSNSIIEKFYTNLLNKGK